MTVEHSSQLLHAGDQAVAPDRANSPPLSRSDRKAWAKANFKGLETILMPSFTPDLKELDEEGIRHDVRMSKKHGFFSVFCAGVGLSPEEQLRMIRIVVDEANGELEVAFSMGFNKDDEKLDLMRLACDAGATHVLLHPSFQWKPADAKELYDWYRRMIDSSDLNIALWATDGQNFRHFAPANIPIDVIDRLGDLDKVIAIKLMTTLDEAVTFQLCERVSDRILIGCVNLKMFPLLSKHYGAQWSGAWTVEALQSPDKPYVTNYVNQLNAGQYDEAIATYHHITPAYRALFQMMAPLLPAGVHPFTQLKYYQWFAGGNGGLLRTPSNPVERDFRLDPRQRENIARAFEEIGIAPTGPAESFVTGRAAYAQGARPTDFDSDAARMYVA
ncbi:MAG: dihydrodipicolinate synthase family protein [Allosphingosinicella sp.]